MDRIESIPIARDGELAQILENREGQAAFNKPWELRVFAVAAAACEAGQFEWSTFQEALTEAIRNWETANPGYTPDDWSYYEHFLTALEVVLARSDLLGEEGLEERARDILAHPPHKHHVARYEPIAVDRAPG